MKQSGNDRSGPIHPKRARIPAGLRKLGFVFVVLVGFFVPLVAGWARGLTGLVVVAVVEVTGYHSWKELRSDYDPDPIEAFQRALRDRWKRIAKTTAAIVAVDAVLLIGVVLVLLLGWAMTPSTDYVACDPATNVTESQVVDAGELPDDESEALKEAVRTNDSVGVPITKSDQLTERPVRYNGTVYDCTVVGHAD